jgi:hypothetical protein
LFYKLGTGSFVAEERSGMPAQHNADKNEILKEVEAVEVSQPKPADKEDPGLPVCPTPLDERRKPFEPKET